MKSALPVALATLLPLSAQALDLRGAELSYGYSQPADLDGQVNTLAGSASANLLGAFTGQIDLFSEANSLTGLRNTGPGASLHLGYELGYGAVLGGFAGVQNWEGRQDSLYGLEAAFGMSNLSGEVVFGQYDFGNGGGFGFGEINVSFDLPSRLTLNGGLARTDGDVDMTIVDLGVEYSLGDFSVAADVANLSGDTSSQSIALTLSYTMGNGADFSRRSWNEIFVAY